MNSKYRYFVFLLLISLNSFAQSGSNKFSKEDVLNDLDYLYNSMQDAHYDLYAYVTKEKFDSVYRAIKASVTQDSLELLETTNTLQRLISAVNNGHTEIDFPGGSYAQYAYAGGTVFPMELSFDGDKWLVRKNFSDNDSIEIGSEVLSIDGKPMQEILSKIYPQISAERMYFKKTKVELYSFPRFYWQVYGQQERFEVTIRDDSGTKEYLLASVDVIDGYESKRSEVLSASMQLKFFETAAYLNPGHFGGEEEKYRSFIDSAFVEIKKRQYENLIIDLRNNGGGDNSFSDYLVSYIADRPFQWNSSFSLKSSKFLKEHVREHNDTTDTYFREILDHEDGEIYDYHFENYQPQAADKRFSGEVYVLVNRQSHSQSAVTAAQIQDYAFGTIVGEETGDYPTLYASQFQYTLPNTGIAVKVSKGQIVRVSGSTKQEGVMPDILIKDYLLDEEDEILSGLLNRLN